MSEFALPEWIQQIEAEIAASQVHNHLLRKEIASGTVNGISVEMIEKGRQKLKWLKELQRYKALEEAGRLPSLPCAVGDIIYRINPGAKDPIIPMGVVSIELKGITDTFKEIKCKDCAFGGENYYRFTDIGKTVFLTKAEAEAKLEELKGGAE